MNLMTGLLRPSRGHITILGIPTDQPEQLFRKVGYCTQFDSFPRGLTGRESFQLLPSCRLYIPVLIIPNKTDTERCAHQYECTDECKRFRSD